MPHYSVWLKRILYTYHSAVLEWTDVVSPLVIFMRWCVDVVPWVASNLDTVIRAWHLEKHWRAICAMRKKTYHVYFEVENIPARSGQVRLLKPLTQTNHRSRLKNWLTRDLDIYWDTERNISHRLASRKWTLLSKCQLLCQVLETFTQRCKQQDEPEGQ